MLIAIGAGISPSCADDVVARIATELAGNLANNRFAAVAERFTSEVARALPVESLQKVWNGVLQQGGAVREVAPIRSDQAMSGGSLVIIPIRLERATIDLKIAVVGDKVAGFFIAPAAPAQSQAWSSPAYVDAGKFRALDVTVGPSALGGTLSLPKSAGKVPAVVLIQGSGPGDRDESVGRTVRSATSPRVSPRAASPRSATTSAPGCIPSSSPHRPPCARRRSTT
jgi:hypothetical protein